MGRSAPRFIYRNRKVCDKIKNRYLPDIPHAEMPHQKRVTKFWGRSQVLKFKNKSQKKSAYVHTIREFGKGDRPVQVAQRA